MYEYKAKLVRIIDGDSLVVDIDMGFHTWIKDQHIRLYGIDAPESRTKDLIEKDYGIKSKLFLENWIGNENELVIETVYPKDKFGRILSMVYKQGNDLSLNQTMVDNFMAVPYNGQSKDQIKELHLENRKQLLNT